jgi:curved DNA-binding protein CbpA
MPYIGGNENETNQNPLIMQNTTTAGQTAIHNMRKAESLNELKQLYRVYAMQFHPDHGGDEETMKAINATFTTMFEILKNHQNTRAEQEHARGNWKGFSTTTETPEEFIDIVNKLHAIGGIVIELCGSWIWISGETKDNREALKAAKCRWSKNKKQWYWRHEEDFCRKHRSHSELEMDEIRDLYGSQILNGNNAQMTIFA